MTDETPQKPTADWYPDPSGTGQLRYWDGEQWTQELRSQEQAAESAAMNNPAQGSAQLGDTAGYAATGSYGVGFGGAQGGAQGGSQLGAPLGNAGQADSQQFARQQHAHSGQSGFFRSLFDLSFAADRSVTTGFVKVIYVIGIALSVISWLGGALMMFVMAGISSAAASAFGSDGGGGMMIFGVLALVLGWIPGFINVIFLRVALEFVTAQIRTSQHTAELVRLGRAAAK